MTTDTVRRGLALLACILLLAPGAGADYTGASLAVAGSGSVTGSVQIEHGSSRYSGEVAPGGSYSVTFPVDVPRDATIRMARVYLFWTWSHDGTEGVAPTLRAMVSGGAVSSVRSYSDRKGSGTYDYPSGTTVYDAVGKAKPGSPLVLTVTNAAPSAAVAFSGAVLLVACDRGAAETRYWIAEGADMLYATGSVTADAATTRITFTGVPALSAGATADLLAVVPGGNKGQNTLSVNGRAFSGLFAGRPYADLAIATTPVGPHLRAGSNTVTLRDEGDFIVPGLFVLRVAGGALATPTASGAAPTGTSTPTPMATVTATATPARTTGQPATTQTQAATMTTITLQTSPSATVTATGVPVPTFTPGLTILPEATGTPVPAAPVENATPTPTTVMPGSAPAVIVSANETQAPFATPAFVEINATTTPMETIVSTTEPTPVPPAVMTPWPTAEPITVSTTEPWTEPTTEPTTVPTTEPTTVASTVQAPTAESLVMGDPAGANDLHAAPLPAQETSNLSALTAGGGNPPIADAALLDTPSGSELVGLGVTIFWLCVGGGIVTASGLVGAGIVSRMGRAGAGRAGSPERDRASASDGPAPRGPPVEVQR